MASRGVSALGAAVGVEALEQSGGQWVRAWKLLTDRGGIVLGHRLGLGSIVVRGGG